MFKVINSAKFLATKKNKKQFSRSNKTTNIFLSSPPFSEYCEQINTFYLA